MRVVLMILILCWSNITSPNTTIATIGWVETVRILPENIELRAKIDTGADNSSLGVVNWQSFHRDGKEWIRFKTLNNSGNSKSFERPLDRYSLIKRKILRSHKRPVVKMWLCIGNKRILVPVNLAKRKSFKYRMLIGRSFLKGHFLVDSNKKLTTTPECNPSQ